jgi:hypothetical protein
MSEQRFLPWVVAALVSVGCGPELADPPPAESTTTEGTSSTSSTSSTGTAVESGASSSSTTSGDESSSAADSGTAGSCEGWEDPPWPYGWSLQDCLTDPCPEGEVCRYDPGEDCGARPVCVNPDTLACRCVLYPTLENTACPCPGYDGPVNKLGEAILECNTGTSPGPVTDNADCSI